MLKIMLCDDDQNDLRALQVLLEEYWRVKGLIPADTYVTQSPEELIKRVKAGIDYDIYILDVLMEEKDGISLGKEIRQYAEQSIIIYVTSSPEFALGAFGIYASGYLLKPVSPRLFAECMDRAVKRVSWRQDVTLVVKSREGIVTLDAGKLMWVENIARVMHYHMENGEVIESVYIRRPFEEQIKELLQDFRFIQTHKSFVINAKYVEKMLQRDFIMTNKTIIPISRSNLGMVRKSYLDYLSKTE